MGKEKGKYSPTFKSLADTQTNHKSQCMKLYRWLFPVVVLTLYVFVFLVTPVWPLCVRYLLVGIRDNGDEQLEVKNRVG